MDNGLQINLTNLNITALFPIPGNNSSTVTYPQPSVNNDLTVIGFNTELRSKKRYIDVHFHGADVTTREIPETRFNDLHNTIKTTLTSGINA
jgi:hypothetical protein